MSGYQLSGNAPAAYQRYGSYTMAPWTPSLIAQADCRHGDRVLDVACGTGIVTTRIDPECKITGIDFNEGMLSVARANTGIDWRQGSATELPFDDASFDVVLCQQGLQYFPDRSKAMKEMARVLAPGGRVSLNVWGRIERTPFHMALVDGTIRFVGEEHKTVFDMAFSLNTVQQLHALADQAGLKKAHVRIEHRTLRHPDASEMIDGFLRSTPIAGYYTALPDETRHACIDHVRNQLSAYIDDDGLAAPMENLYLLAYK